MDTLEKAVKIAIQSTPPPSAPSVKDMAQAALSMIEKTRAALDHFDLEPSSRHETAVTLLLASMDQARSLCYLLANDGEESWYAALILLRTQIDHFIRGGFFGKPASDSELSFFLKQNKIPSRTPPGQKQRPLSLNELVAINIQAYKWDGEKLQTMIKNHWRPFSGLVHGGVECLNLYIDHDTDVIGAGVDLEELREVITNVAALAHMVIAVMMDLSPLTPGQLHDVVKPIHEEFKSFTKRYP